MAPRVRVRSAAAVALTAVVVSACGAGLEPEVAALPVAVAEPISVGELGLELRLPGPAAARTPDRGVRTPGTDLDERPAQDAEAPAATSDLRGPTTADAAAFVRAVAPELGAAEHVVVDVDGDHEAEVVLAGLLGRRAVLRVAWWTDEGYRALAELEAGRGIMIDDLRVADVNEDTHTELLVMVEGEGRASLALFTVLGRGRVSPLTAVGGCHDGSHVYGVTGARLESRGEAPPAVVATCDDSPLPVRDWSEQRWVWRDGAYRFEQPPATEGDPHDDRDDDAGDDAPGRSGDAPGRDADRGGADDDRDDD